jgi:hypothetical protein
MDFYYTLYYGTIADSIFDVTIQETIDDEVHGDLPGPLVIVSLQILLDIPCWIEIYVVGMVVKGFDD